MSRLPEEFEELRAQLGIGAGIYIKDPNDGKFHIAFLTEEVPSFSGDTETAEINVTTSTRKTKIAGKETLEDVEFEIFSHRDNKTLCEKYEKEPQEWLIVDGDYSGERATGSMTWKNGSRTSDDPTKITVKITPTNLISKNVKNALPLIKQTAKFATDIPATVELDTTTGTYVKDISLSPADATFEAESDTVAVATANVSGGKLTITGVKEGHAMITLKSEKEGYASWETTILVIVPKTEA